MVKAIAVTRELRPSGASWLLVQISVVVACDQGRMPDA